MLSLLNKREEGRIGRLLGAASLALALCAGVMLALMMYITFADVIMRYILGRPIAGSVEIIYCLMGLMICMGFGLTTFEGGHIRVDILTSTMPRRLRRLCDVLAHALSVFTAGIVTWRLTLTALEQAADRNITQVLHLPVWIVALIMAACSVMLVLTLLLRGAEALRHLTTPG